MDWLSNFNGIIENNSPRRPKISIYQNEYEDIEHPSFMFQNLLFTFHGLNMQTFHRLTMSIDIGSYAIIATCI